MNIKTEIVVKHTLELDADKLEWLKSYMQNPPETMVEHANEKAKRHAFFNLLLDAEANGVRGGGFVEDPPVVVSSVALGPTFEDEEASA